MRRCVRANASNRRGNNYSTAAAIDGRLHEAACASHVGVNSLLDGAPAKRTGEVDSSIGWVDAEEREVGL
eukprot:scaffold271618_cov30-Tisochrysis_lutea.AAC.3